MQWENQGGVAGQSTGSVMAQPQALPFSFTGSGSEYFRIWIVNTLLTIVTFGIYSAWAKVRTLQYFYRNTRLDNASFDYHGKPVAILKGRIIAFLLLGVVQWVGQVNTGLAVVIALLIAVVMPLLLVRSLRFRMANSSYRGLRFAFRGTDPEGYKVFLLWPLLAALTLGLLAPSVHQRLKQFQHGNARFGTAPFSFDATVSAFYRVYVSTSLLSLLFIVGGLLTGLTSGQAGVIIMATLFGVFLSVTLVGPFFRARMQNLIWNRTALAPHGFRSEVGVGRLYVIVFTNLILIAVTLGLFIPFARVRTARYFVESMTLQAAGPLDSFIAGEVEQVGALGDAAADWYDIDIAL